MLSFVVVALSWVYYHYSVEDLPYLGIGRSWLRFSLDTLVVVVYTWLVLSVDSIPTYGIVLSVIYMIYCIHGFATVYQHGWFRKRNWFRKDALKPNSTPMYWFLYALYFYTVSTYPWRIHPRFPRVGML